MSGTSHQWAKESKWVSFDCYGTLVDWLGGFTAILRPIAGERTSELLQAYYHFEPQVQARKPHLRYREVLIASLLLAAGEISISMTEAEARRLPEQWSSLPVIGDVERALAELRKDGFNLAVLTNCDEDLFVLTQRSFQKPFDLVITAERVQEYKPSLAHFTRFKSVTGVHFSNWVHVANSWFHDIEPAIKMGIKNVWLDREEQGAGRREPCLRITSAVELPKIVRRVLNVTNLGEISDKG
jgi:2-haloacid dehalogenase